MRGRFAYNHIQPVAIDNAIVSIYHNAHANVRQWYTYWGVDGTSKNWIIRWFLYKIFRYRDARNSRKLDFHADDDDENGEEDGIFHLLYINCWTWQNGLE